MMIPNDTEKPFKNGFLGFMLSETSPNIIYEHGLVALRGYQNLPTSEAKVKANLIFTSNFNLAIAFFKGAEIYNQQQKFELAVFMLHQSTEFVYKAFLLSISEIEIKTHEIQLFKAHMEGIAPSINAVLVNLTDEDIRLFKLLEDAYQSATYDDSFAVRQEDFNLLKERIMKLHIEAPKIFENLMNGLVNSFI